MSSWDEATKNTKDAWNFGTDKTDSQIPALNYADYDGYVVINIIATVIHPLHLQRERPSLDVTLSSLGRNSRW